MIIGNKLALIWLYCSMNTLLLYIKNEFYMNLISNCELHTHERIGCSTYTLPLHATS